MADAMDGAEAVGAMSCTNYRRASRAYGSGRVCAEPGCSTVLSIYNADDRCARHAVVAGSPRRRSRDGRGRAISIDKGAALREAS
jgi:hypothetical protein